MRFICEPERTGNIIRMNTSTPMPPIQCEKLLQKRVACESASTSETMEAPVVVKPEMISNRAST